MDANLIIENLLDRIKGLIRENAFLVARVNELEKTEEGEKE